MGVFGIRYFDESAPDSSGAVSYGAKSGDGVSGSIANGHVVPGPICSLTLGRSGLFGEFQGNT